MRIIHDVRELSNSPRASVITIGNFDGVHLAHQQLLKQVVESALSAGAVATAVTFDPHPASILKPGHAPSILTSVAHKARLMEGLGIDALVILPFTQELARVTPQDFVHEILVKNLRPISVYVGPNFRFGHRQAGNTETLEELARREGFKVETLPMLELRGERVSSSRIRRLLAEGKVGMAGRLLGRPYSIHGRIARGLGVGKKQTVPTLNLAPIPELVPREGVYVTRTRLGDKPFDSVTNVGHKPTFGEHRLTVESHVLNFTGDVPESEMEITYLHRLRDEMKFPDAAALKTQIQKDARRAEQFFRLTKLLQDHP